MLNSINQEKYRNIHTATTDEISILAAKVKQDCDFLPCFHIHPTSGLLNDPNGLVFDGEKYHIFFQWYPFGPIHGLKHWKHYTTSDFISYKQAETLVPTDKEESHGCYSGGAILYDNKITCFYTGNRRYLDNETLQRQSSQRVAIFTKDGTLESKKTILDRQPQEYTSHFRDPKPWVTEDNRIKFLLGTQSQNLIGGSAVYEMKNLQDTPHYLGDIKLQNAPAKYTNNHIYMWECPSLVPVDNKDVLIYCPQGIEKEKYRYNNIFSTVYSVGKFDNKTLDFTCEHMDELDKGFDFYAPQSISKKGEQILIGWVGQTSADSISDARGWQGALTMPRKIWLENNKLKQYPVPSILELKTNPKSYQITADESAKIDNNLSCSYILWENKGNQELDLNLFDDGINFVNISYKEKVFCLDRTHTLMTDQTKSYGTKRQVKIEKLQTLEIFMDKSVCEIYLNGGEEVLTSCIYIKDKTDIIHNLGENLSVKIWDMNSISGL